MKRDNKDTHLTKPTQRNMKEHHMEKKNVLESTGNNIAFLGPEGTFSHQASLNLFDQSNSFLPCETIEDIFTRTESLECFYGVIPVENSAQGTVAISMDCVVRTRLSVIAEAHLPVRQMLLSNEKNLSKITHIYSHPQPLLQCRNWLLKNCPGVTQEALSSTAEAAVRASKNPTSAAIGSDLLADRYHLNIVRENIHGAANNITRFWVLGASPRPVEAEKNYKTSLWFITPHKPGALFDVLKIFAESEVNITRIESRPFPGKPWEYIFFLDMKGHQQSKNVQQAIEQLPACAEQFRVIGSYPAAT